MVDVLAAVIADVPAIRRIACESWHTAYGEFVPEPAIEGTLAAEKEGHGVVGHAGATAGGEDGTAILTSVYVVPERWDEGIGTALLEGVTGRLRERGFERIRERAEELGGERYDALVVERGL